MPDLKVAFWNVRDLFEPGRGIERAPKSEAELDAKIAAIARFLNTLFGNAGPDLIGFAEIHTDRILRKLVDQLKGHYRALLEPSRNAVYAQTGLAVLARSDRFASLDRMDAYFGSDGLGRPRYLIAQCKLVERDDPIFFVVNHWKSDSDSSGPTPAEDRLATAKRLNAWLTGIKGEICAVVLGDFNAEPFGEPFGPSGLCAERHLGPRVSLPHHHLYNTAWRFLAEPDLCEDILNSAENYTASRPKTTIDSFIFPSAIFDQLLVSQRAIRGNPIALQESTVKYAFDDTIGYRNNGHMKPRRWDFGTGVAKGVSDHFPLIATFHIREA